MDDSSSQARLILGITGASGMIFLKSFLNTLADVDIIVHGICSEAGIKVMETELGFYPGDLHGVAKWFEADDFAAAPASGSSDYSSMVILPCTMGTLAAVAAGLTINLIHRAADVMLKEKKKLVMAVRETPLNRTHLKNMLAVNDAGAVICPIMPGFYLQPKTLEEVAQIYSWRLADQLGIKIPKRKRWGK